MLISYDIWAGNPISPLLTVSWLYRVLNVKALVGAFNQEKALVGAFSVIVKSSDIRITFVSSTSGHVAASTSIRNHGNHPVLVHPELLLQG